MSYLPNCSIERASQKQCVSGTVAMTQRYPEITHESLIENGTMMGGGWEVDGRCRNDADISLTECSHAVQMKIEAVLPC